MEVRKNEKIGNLYNQVPQLTQSTEWESDKITRKHHIQESQEVSPFSTGNHKAAQYGKDKHPPTPNPQKKHGLEMIKNKIFVLAIADKVANDVVVKRQLGTANTFEQNLRGE